MPVYSPVNNMFADGEPRVKPLLIFKGKGKPCMHVSLYNNIFFIFCTPIGKRISIAERMKYDRRVSVEFQQNAWCDEQIMKIWVRQMRKPACHENMVLVMDVHRAQTTDTITELLQEECYTDIEFVPGKSIISLILGFSQVFLLHRWLYKPSSTFGCQRQ